MSPQVSVGMIIRYASHNLRFINSTNTKDLKECPKVLPENHDENVCQPLHRFPMSQNPQVGHLNIHQVARSIPLSPQISMARHTSSVLKSLKTQSDKIFQRENSIHYKKVEGEKHHKIQLVLIIHRNVLLI